MPGVFGITGSGIGTLGAKADACNSLAVGPGAQAVNYSLAMGPNVCTDVEHSIAIGSRDIECVRIGCYNLGVVLKEIKEIQEKMQECLNAVF